MEKVAFVLIVVAMEVASAITLPLFVGPVGSILTGGVFFTAWWSFGLSAMHSTLIALATCYLVVLVKHRVPASIYIGDICNMLIGSSKGNSFRKMLKADRAEKKIERKRVCGQRRRAMRIILGLPLPK
ncbi:hypothetical protein G6L37_05795 [Agrobacterium rubi]|nr:hypothetical protein [Agrobacterium rubi]NTF24872.1 hypothetical protein [Agrobacterium rubi]